ncbi:hypothetical protein DFQ30_004090 [Apophysomyces sp. BC1015]|nr:hypothetical protein DFQ30_004090 [Apophysomyces sp. BC1015]KAG0178146.1 hypothetical protein DFQ29_003874 [Apophysomyces sp. BC1021]
MLTRRTPRGVLDRANEIGHFEAKMITEKTPPESDTSDPSKEEIDTRIRTCTVPASRIIRKDLPEEHKELFKTVISDIALALTNNISKLSVVVHDLMLEYSRNEIIVARDVFLFSNISQFQASQLVPNTALRDKLAVDGNGCICVAPLSLEVLDYVAKIKGKMTLKACLPKSMSNF